MEGTGENTKENAAENPSIENPPTENPSIENTISPDTKHEPPYVEFLADYKPSYGKAERLTPLISRMTAKNRTPFTFTGTGTYIVGKDSLAVIDPGPMNKKHIKAMGKEFKNKTVSHILITHTHSDHSPAAEKLKEITGAKTYGFGPHPKSNPSDILPDQDEEGGDGGFVPDVKISNGDVIEGSGWTIECIHTPGHLSNHICFHLKEEDALFSGDHVMGWSTSIIPPPHGRLGDYLKSLEMISKRDIDLYWPTHGPPIPNPEKLVRSFIDHRKHRTSQLLSCLKDGQHTMSEIVGHIYADYPKKMHIPAGRSMLAHIIYLLDYEKIRFEGDLGTESARYYLK